MERKPVTYAEKIAARYERRGRDQCWMWDGNVDSMDGLPNHNQRDVTRYIFEQEFGPIPDGYNLHRTDHDENCDTKTCRHKRCVNPYHRRLVESVAGHHDRGGRFPAQDSSEWANRYTEKHRERKRRRRSAVKGNPKDRHVEADD